MINTDLGVALVTVTTMSAIVFIGLGFLARPSRASAMWAISFALAMVSSYGWVTSEAIASPALRALASGGLLASATLTWVGLRARRHTARPMWIIAAVFCVTVPAILVLTVDTDYYTVVFRLAFIATSVFAAMNLFELTRLGPRLRDESMPLMIVSAVFLLFSLLTVIDGVGQFVSTGTVAGADGLQLVRDLNTLGALIYVVCTLITLLLIVRKDSVEDGLSARSPFRTVAEDRLHRAHASADEWWSVLEIRLDDPRDLREASNSTAYGGIVAGFVDDVRAVLPADADIEHRNDTTLTVLLPRPEGAVRQILVRMLERIATARDDQPLAVRLSASIGWAPVEAVGYSLDDLLAAAQAAASRAQSAGGDRWERVQRAAQPALRE